MVISTHSSLMPMISSSPAGIVQSASEYQVLTTLLSAIELNAESVAEYSNEFPNESEWHPLTVICAMGSEEQVSDEIEEGSSTSMSA
jgi:hypothetical protein